VVSTVATTPLLAAEGVVKHFRVGGGLRSRAATVHAVAGVDLELRRGEILALVGESGSGKSTLGRCLLGLTRPTAGRIVFDGTDLSHAGGRRLRELRRRLQPVFQNPFGSLDPRWTIERTVREPLDAYQVGSASERRARVRELLDAVGLSERHATSRPRELSGGQCQRAAIAAALALSPDVLVADEAVSALDVLVQAQILNLIAALQRDLGLAIVFITHDLAVVEHLADRTAVMYLGRIVESGPTELVLGAPRHPYTRALIDAIPLPDPSRRTRPSEVRGEIPSALAPPAGCRFHPRCPRAVAVCAELDPQATDFGGGQLAACHVARAEAFGDGPAT
jgi:oligopeptide/dipeptide ABC transporter ATP-binding protein